MAAGDGVGDEDTLMLILKFAAALFLTGLTANRRVSIPLMAAVTFGLMGGVLTGSASALEGINLNSPAEPTAAGECPRLIEIKYPFLNCANGQIGEWDGNETWDNMRRIPKLSEWSEGDGTREADLNFVH
jgi:hypothetical protein